MAPLQPGDRAPDFSATAHDGTAIQLADLVSQSAVVLFFYPKDFTPGCTTEVCTFRDAHADFVDAGATVIGVSADDSNSHNRFADQHNLPFALVSDNSGQLRESYGVGKRWGLLPGRITFVIDQQGIIRHVFNSAIFAQRHSKEALEAVQKLSTQTAG